MAKEFKHDGETFLLDDSKGCFVEVTYAEHQEYVGVVGVSIKGTESSPHAVSVISTPNGSVRHKAIEGDKITRGDIVRDTRDISAAIHKCCEQLIAVRRQYEVRKQFDSEAACRNLHEQFENLPES